MTKFSIIVPAYNEEKSLSFVLKNLIHVQRILDALVIVVDDGSTDKTFEVARRFTRHVLRNNRNSGVGYSIVRALDYPEGYPIDYAVIVSADNQHSVLDVVRIMKIAQETGADMVQGVRKITRFHDILVRLYSLYFSFWAGKYIGDCSNGLRAIKLSALNGIPFGHPRYNRYELEPYLLYKFLREKTVKTISFTPCYPVKPKLKWNLIKALLKIPLLLRLGVIK